MNAAQTQKYKLTQNMMRPLNDLFCNWIVWSLDVVIIMTWQHHFAMLKDWTCLVAKYAHLLQSGYWLLHSFLQAHIIVDRILFPAFLPALKMEQCSDCGGPRSTCHIAFSQATSPQEYPGSTLTVTECKHGMTVLSSLSHSGGQNQ